MKTIGAKELRLHLDQILDRVLSGEDIIVQHRFKGPVRLSAARKQTTTTQHQKRLAGLAALDKAAERPSPFDPKRPLKELYHESISRQYLGDKTVS